MARELSYVLIFVGLILQATTLVVADEPQVPCYFIFGDSFVDAGNCNNDVDYRANYSPYGIDLPEDEALGRFTNGRTFADIIGEHLGFPKFIPPYATRTNEDIKTGVNYACGRDRIQSTDTGSLPLNLVNLRSLEKQLIQHEADITILANLQNNLTFTNEYLKKCLYLVNIGTHDFLRQGNFGSRALLIQSYVTQLWALRTLGARKVAVFGLGELGCSPQIRHNDVRCSESANNEISSFNNELKDRVNQLNNPLVEGRFTFISVTNVSESQEDVPEQKYYCCDLHHQDYELCIADRAPCYDRNATYFYDGLHPTEFINKIIAKRAYEVEDETYAYPYNISRLAQF